MKNVLIWDARISIKNSGGPSGYLYQIKRHLISNTNNQIHFLSDYLSGKEETLSKKYKNISNITKTNKILTIIRKLFSIYRLTHKKFPKQILKELDLNQFTHIHFHVSLDYYNARHILKGYNGCIVLTSHSPEPISVEIVNQMFNNKTLYSYWAEKHIKKAECWAFKNADKIMFPVPESTEPYCHNEDLKKILIERQENLIYCPTAILPYQIDMTYVKNFKESMNIPKDAFVISYIGRHNSVKGYDLLKVIGEKILNTYNNVYFVIAGSKGPIEELNHERWIEIGWTDKANEIITASDLFILPNRETYFDLITLEVLRSGTPLLMSFTGGNKYFHRMYPNHKGFDFFEIDNGNLPIEQISKFINYKTTNGIESLRESNINLWKSDFTLQTYIKNYITVL